MVTERLKLENFYQNANLTVAKTAVEKLVKERASLSFAEMDAASIQLNKP